MTVLCDFQTIIGDVPVPVDQALGGAQVQLPQRFNTGGRISSTREHSENGRQQPAFLVYSVSSRGNRAGTAQVFLNEDREDIPESNISIGTITHFPGPFRTEMIALSAEKLLDGKDNEITLRHVTEGFMIKNLICFYHQDSD
jgi:hypothetical protein